MNKAQLVQHVAEELGTSRPEAERAVKAVFDSIMLGIKYDGSVGISGFGTFNRKVRAARRGRNPRTGELMHISESTTVSFKPGGHLKGVFQET